MKRVQQLWPPDLHERVAEAAGRRGITDFTIAALELALKDFPAQGTEQRPPKPGSSPAAPPEYVPGPEDALLRRCKLNCGRPVPQSPKAVRCSCGGFLVPG